MRSILASAAGLLRDAEALALPAACLGCGGYLSTDADGSCCAVCRSRLRPLAPPVCARCGQPRDPWEAGGGTRSGAAGCGGRAGARGCGFCRGWPEAFAWAGSAVWMEEGPARELVHALKYGGWRVAAAPMAEAMVRACGARLRSVDVCVPVPLGVRRLRERGYNQAAVLAGALARHVHVRMEPGALVRVRETRTQTALPPAERWTNVAGAFAAASALRGARVAVVDDVLTTGATLAACAAALATAGAGTVGAVTFARAAVPN